MEQSQPIATFFRISTAHYITVTDAQQEKEFNILKLQEQVSELLPIEQKATKKNLDRKGLRHHVAASQSSSKVTLFWSLTTIFILAKN